MQSTNSVLFSSICMYLKGGKSHSLQIFNTCDDVVDDVSTRRSMVESFSGTTVGSGTTATGLT